MKRKKIYHSWLASYLIIICVAFLCSISIYLIIGEVVKQEVDRSNAVILENVRLSTDSYINDMQKIATDIRDNPLFEAVYLDKLEENDFVYASVQLQKELSHYQAMNTDIASIYLYIKDRDYIISGNRAVPADIMYEIDYKNTGITLEEWKQLLSDSSRSVFRQLTSASGGGVQQQLALFSPLPAISENPSAVLVITVSADAIGNALKNGKLEEHGVLFILNSQDQVLMSNREWKLPVTYEMLQDGKQQKLKMNDASYIMTSAKSSAMNMRYVLAIPNNTYYKTAIVVRNIAFAGVFIFLALALYVAFQLLKKNYRPLRELMGYVNDAYGTAEEEENEYHVFQSAISRAVAEKAQMQNKLKQQSNTVRDHMLGNLLKGKTENNLQLEDILFSNGIDFAEAHIRVLVFYVEYFDELFEGSSKEIEEQTSLAFLVVRNITQELLDRHFQTVFVEVDDMMVCLLNAKKQDDGQALTIMKETIKEAKDIIKENFYIDFTVSVSGAHESANGVAVAYQEAMEAMEYKIIMGSGGTICYDELEVKQENYYYPMNTELIIVNALKAGDEDTVRDTLDRLFYRNFTQGHLSLAMAKCFISNLVSTFLKVLEDMRIQIQIDMEPEMEKFNRILSGVDVVTAQQMLQDMIHRICGYAKQRPDSSAKKIVEQVKQYVSENYHDFNLSLYSIADEFHITYTHLSRVFKAETGEGLLQYINKIRMAAAKKLLLETEQSITQIAEAVGYGNSNSLIRAFKKYNGITPGKFRELNQ